MRDNLFSSYIAKCYVGRKLTDNELMAVRSGDVDIMTETFIKIKEKDYQKQLKSAFKSMKIFLGDKVTLEDISQKCEVQEAYIACQIMDGDENIFLGFAGEEDSLLTVASTFATEKFLDFNADVYDAVCELINCINGAYATKLSHEEDIELTLHPPVFYNHKSIRSNNKIYVVKLKINNKPIELIMAINGNLIIE